jgi:hypothetical protein
MSKWSKFMAFAASLIIIFIAGTKWGMHMTRSNQKTYESDSFTLGNVTPTSTSAENIMGRKQERGSHEAATSFSPKQNEIMGDIRNAMALPKDSRTAPLLKALEQTTKLPLSKVLLDNMRLIIDEGEIESSHFVLSLMEQREDESAVELLLHAAGHQDPDVADRALFALEAVAGTVFKNREEAAKWAVTWQPDPERVKLFAPVQENEAAAPMTADTRLPGPRSKAPKSSTQNPEE